MQNYKKNPKAHQENIRRQRGHFQNGNGAGESKFTKQKRGNRNRFAPCFDLGSGGRIRTTDLRVMSTKEYIYPILLDHPKTI
jgi:hypothetical protein